MATTAVKEVTPKQERVFEIRITLNEKELKWLQNAVGRCPTGGESVAYMIYDTLNAEVKKL